MLKPLRVVKSFEAGDRSEASAVTEFGPDEVLYLEERSNGQAFVARKTDVDEACRAVWAEEIESPEHPVFRVPAQTLDSCTEPVER